VDIQNREHLYLLVSTFYSRIKTNELLGPIFTAAIPEDEWNQHMEKITEFWNSAVFGSMTYRGNPAMKHVQVDKSNDFSVTQNHFKVWLDNWNSVVDENFSGAVAENVKMRARKMATGLYIGMWNNKPEEKRPK